MAPPGARRDLAPYLAQGGSGVQPGDGIARVGRITFNGPRVAQRKGRPFLVCATENDMRHYTMLSLLSVTTALGLATLAPLAATAQPGAVAFETVDADGDGAISQAEFEAFAANHSSRMEHRGERASRQGEARRDRARGDERMRGAMQERMPAWARERMSESMRGAERMHGRFGMAPGMMGPGMMGPDMMGHGMMGIMGAVSPETLAEALVSRFDTDGDASLDAEEIAAAMRALREDPSARLGVIFAIIDTDGDGVISEEEFEAAHERMMERMGRAGRGGWGRFAPDADDAPEAD